MPLKPFIKQAEFTAECAENAETKMACTRLHKPQGYTVCRYFLPVTDPKTLCFSWKKGIENRILCDLSDLHGE